MTEVIERSNQERIRTFGEKQIYKYLRIFEADTIKQEEMKEKNFLKYLRKTRKLLETKQSNNQRDKHQGCPHFL